MLATQERPRRPPLPMAIAFVGSFSALILGTAVAMLGAWRLAPLFLVIALPVVGYMMWLAAKRWQDPFNPLSVVLALGLARFSLPALLVALDTKRSLATPIYRQIGLSAGDVQAGHALALIGLLAVGLPWLVGPTTPFVLRRATASTAVLHGAVIVSLGGLVAWVLFVNGNAGSVDVLLSGAFRSLTTQEGTGAYFYGALFLISGSVFFTSWLAHRGYSIGVALVPVLMASAAYFVMGGRARSLTPTAAGALVIWWISRAKAPTPRRRHRRTWPRVIVLSLLVVVFFTLGGSYRGGRGFGTDEFGATKLKERVLVDIGQIHGMAAAMKSGAGITDGNILGAGLAWPLTEFTPILSAPSAGVLILERTAGNIFGTRKWGLLPSVSVEAFLDFGIPGVIAEGLVFGWILKRAYLWARSARFSSATCAVIIVYLVRIYFESIGKLSEMWVVLLGVLAVSVVTSLLVRTANPLATSEPALVDAVRP